MPYLSELYAGAEIFGNDKSRYGIEFPQDRKYRINILAVGDVGGMLLTGLTLLGGDCVESIGIYDLSQNIARRFEAEMNQIAYPFEACSLPGIEMIDEDKLFDCDVFVFCATKAVPEVSSDVSDVRMAQFEENRKIAEYYGGLSARREYKGIFAVVSDPVDPLCKAAYLASGLSPLQFRGFGLGVMNSRAIYYAKKEKRFERFVREGRVFGPHGQDLVVADSITDYDHAISEELTKSVVTCNLRMREIGFKPYIAPALSSGAISILLMLRGEWHYSSNFIGSGKDGAYFGAKNRMAGGRVEVENLCLPDALFERIKRSYENLRKIR